MSTRILWIVLGAFSILVGILALADPLAATLAAEQMAGWAFLILGILQLKVVVLQDPGRSFWNWEIAMGAVLFLIGMVLVFKPLEGILSLTLAVASLFLVSGIVRVVLAFTLRGSGAFWVVLLGGAVAIALGAMIFANFPASAATVLGVLLGVELISTGVTMIALSGTRPGGTVATA